MKSIILCLALFAIIECKELGLCADSKSPKCGPSVEVGVYIEALCPYSKLFVNQQLFPTFNKLKASPQVMTVNLVTFGNAKMTFNKTSAKQPSLTYTCQHKDQECEGNILESCAVIKYDNIEKSLPFVNCMFNSTNWKTPWTAAAECTKKLNLDYNELSQCANSLEGISNQYFMAGQTLALDPAHTYVPWITINGKHTDDIQNKATSNLLKLVCDTYPGSPKPTPCKTA